MKSFAITSTKERFGAPNPDEDAEKVQLSDKAHEEFISFFKSKDFYETLKTNEVTDRWGEFAGLKDKNNYLNQSSVLAVNSIYKLIHSTDEEKVAAYAQNKKEIDETYSLFEKEMRNVDMFGFVIPMMQTRKNSINDPSLRKEISDALDVYYALYTKMTIVAGEHENKIKKLMGKE